MEIFMCNLKLFKILFVSLGMYSMLSFALEVPNKNESSSLEETLSALETAVQKAGEHIAATQQARTAEEEKSKGIQTVTVTPIQPIVQPIVKREVQSQPQEINKAAQDQLIKAILDGSVDEIKKAISAGADVNNVESDGKTPIWQALLLGKFGLVNALLESGAKTDVKYRDKTFVQAVVDVLNNMGSGTLRSNNIDPLIIKTLSLLVAKGVDFSVVKITKGSTIADMIVQLSFGNVSADLLELMQQLALHGYPKIADKIWIAGFEWNKDLITFCLKNGIDVNQNIPTGAYNLSPMPMLFFAIRQNNNSKIANDGIENLLNAGADINLQANPDGKGMQTPLDYAESLGKTGAIRVLMQRGAKTASELK